MTSNFSTTAVGDMLEKQIYELFGSEIAGDRFWVKKENCRIFWKKGYFSKDRATEIIFDVAIEVLLPGATEYSMLVLIECKNHKRSVTSFNQLFIFLPDKHFIRFLVGFGNSVLRGN